MMMPLVGKSGPLMYSIRSLRVASGFIKNMADQVEDKRLEGISDIRDESDRNGMRIVIELKRDTILVLGLQLLPVQALEGDEAHVADGLGLDVTSSTST